MAMMSEDETRKYLKECEEAQKEDAYLTDDSWGRRKSRTSGKIEALKKVLGLKA